MKRNRTQGLKSSQRRLPKAADEFNATSSFLHDVSSVGVESLEEGRLLEGSTNLWAAGSDTSLLLPPSSSSTSPAGSTTALSLDTRPLVSRGRTRGSPSRASPHSSSQQYRQSSLHTPMASRGILLSPMLRTESRPTSRFGLASAQNYLQEMQNLNKSR